MKLAIVFTFSILLGLFLTVCLYALLYEAFYGYFMRNEIRRIMKKRKDDDSWR